MTNRKATYSEKLKDPRWQRRRLLVLDAYGFCCESCGDDTQELHVHHNVYKKGREPWEYEDHELRPLCVKCHKAQEDIRDEFLSILGKVCPVYPLGDILNAVKTLFDTGREMEFYKWFACARHPDLMDKASERERKPETAPKAKAKKRVYFV